MNRGNFQIMGILNLTPDSFSDGGKHNTLKKALKRVKEMIKDGVDIIDIGGESTGPGSKKVSLKEEIKRTIKIIQEIRKITSLPISIDTYKAKVADEALKNGANIVNDITALRGDKNMAKIIAKHNCPVVIMYSKDKTPRTSIKAKNYQDIIRTIKNFLEKQIKYAKKHNIKHIIIDPGMGHYISSNPKYSYEIITRLNELKELNLPILVGLSRKSFLGGQISQREEKGNALSAIAYLNGASIIRTHDIKGVNKIINSLG